MVSKEEILEWMGTSLTPRVTERLQRMAYIPDTVMQTLASECLNENWGADLFVLEKYLSVHVGWSVEQSRFTVTDDQLFVSAGWLQSRYGTPLYLVFEKNRNPGRQPLALVRAGSRISAPQLPIPPEIPDGPHIPRGVEIVLSHDHILADNADRVAFLAQTPPVAQICAVSGAIQWALNRSLQLPYWYYGRMNYVVPLYLTSRENVAMAPDLVAPVEVSEQMLLVRTVFLPHMPYANARVAASRHDRLPPWMLDCWNREAANMQKHKMEDPEA